ncbi:hypothetical protein BH10PSE19_BH10PSE19_01090 [soil metagenome]
MNYIDLLKNIWNSIYDPKTEVIETIEKFFHQDYEQCINGVGMNRTEYIHHILEQKKNISIDTIDYKHILEKGNELFAIYFPRGRNINNLPIEAEVIAYFRFENQQIFRIHGQVRLMKGDLADIDMKSS